MSMPTTRARPSGSPSRRRPRSALRANVRSIIRIRPQRTCGYSIDGAVEAPDRGEDDVVEIALAAAVALHRIEAQLEAS
jgi:hypothetical protein